MLAALQTKQDILVGGPIFQSVLPGRDAATPIGKKEDVIMTLVRWTPRIPNTFRDLTGFHEELDRLFGDLAGPGQPFGRGAFVPPVDIDETSDAYVLRLDLPGVTQKDIKVSLVGDTLTIRGERHTEREHKDGSRVRTERLAGAFERTFTLGSRVRADQVQAVHRDGVLEVRVPKAEEAMVRDIEVRAS